MYEKVGTIQVHISKMISMHQKVFYVNKIFQMYLKVFQFIQTEIILQ